MYFCLSYRHWDPFYYCGHYMLLYVTSMGIFIGCWPWSIRGHTHRWRQIHVILHQRSCFSFLCPSNTSGVRVRVKLRVKFRVVYFDFFGRFFLTFLLGYYRLGSRSSSGLALGLKNFRIPMQKLLFSFLLNNHCFFLATS